MFDNKINKILKPILNPIGIRLFELNVKPNHITLTGFVFGLTSFIFIIKGFLLIALVFFLLNRLMDGLDGCVARQSKASDLGGYLDIVSDFIIYSILPFGFIIYDQENALAFSFLLSSFIGTCSTFLASAWVIEKNKSLFKLNIKKSFFYTNGVAEGFETIFFFIIIFIFPDYASIFAWVFGILCWITVIVRLIFVNSIFLKINKNNQN